MLSTGIGCKHFSGALTRVSVSSVFIVCFNSCNQNNFRLFLCFDLFFVLIIYFQGEEQKWTMFSQLVGATVHCAPQIGCNCHRTQIPKINSHRSYLSKQRLWINYCNHAQNNVVIIRISIGYISTLTCLIFLYLHCQNVEMSKKCSLMCVLMLDWLQILKSKFTKRISLISVGVLVALLSIFV